MDRRDWPNRLYNLPTRNILQQGGGHILRVQHGLRFLTVAADRHGYSNAQLDDYGSIRRHVLPHRPPVRMTLRACFPTTIHGTAGFGFWNNPIALIGGWPALPAAAWFFYAAPPANIAPALGVPGHGWKAAVIDAGAPSAWPWVPFAPIIVLLNRIPALRRRIWPRIQRALRVAEQDLGAPAATWRTYTLEWQPNCVLFQIDGHTVFETPYAPRGPLGFVVWVDTQWLIATPDGQFGWGLHDASMAQWIDVADIEVSCIGDTQVV